MQPLAWADPPPAGSACTITGTVGPNTLNGTAGSDVICGLGGDDTINGLGGDDLIIGGGGVDTIDGGAGKDDVRGGPGADVVVGGTEDDILYGGGDADDLNGGDGADRVLGDGGDDTLTGGEGADDIRGDVGMDTISGSGGDDDLFGGDDNDTIGGDAGADLVVGGPGDDQLSGGDDNDLTRGGIGNDTHAGESGNDQAVDRDGSPYVDDVTCGDGTDTADVDFADTVDADCESERVLDRDDPMAVNDTKTVTEDAAATTVPVLFNDTDADGGPVKVDSVTQPTNGTVVRFDRKVTYEPNANYCNQPPGTTLDTFTYTLAPGGSTATVSVKVKCVDDAPVAVDDDATVTEDDTPQTIPVLGNDTDIDGGPISITSTTDPAAGTVVITGGGTGLTYEPDANACNNPPGTTPDTFDYTLSPGNDIGTVSVKVDCVDDPAAPVDDSATVDEDDPATAIDVLGNDTPGDGGITITGASDPANGAVVITGGGTGLTYQPDANYCNTPPGTTLETFTYTVDPGAVSATVTVTVNCVNDAPVADDESYSGASAAVGNTVLVHDDATDGAPAESGPKKVITGDLLAGDTDLETPGALSLTVETVTTADGGTAVIEADGDFVYTPAAGTSCTDHSDSFAYNLNDGDGGGDIGVVTIETAGCVWYVNNSAAGNAGTSNAPFDTLAQAEASSAAGDTIYVHDGDNSSTGYAAGITLKANQRLLGELADLVIGADTLATGVAGNRPTITASGADVVTLDDANTLRGLEIDPSGAGGGIAGGAGDAGGTITDVRIIDGGTAGTQPGLELDGTSGTFNVSDLTVSTTGATGIRANSAGTLAMNTGTNQVTTSGAKALDIAGTHLAVDIDSVTVTGSGAGGVSLTNTTGNVLFTDLSLTTTSGTTAAFAVSNAQGVLVQGFAGTTTVNATGGPAVDIQTAPAALFRFDSVTSTNSASNGLRLNNITGGDFDADAGTLQGFTSNAVEVAGGNGNVTYDGTILDGSGPTANIVSRTAGTVSFTGSISDGNDAGGGITLANNTGGSTVFSGSSKVFNTANLSAVSMVASNGHTLSFTNGGLDIDTTSAMGFNANDSGTVVVSGATNTLDTGTGEALNIINTDIGAADVTFQRISASLANVGSQGIVLDSTGAAGNLVVTGNGGTCTFADTSGCSGGTISGFTGADDSSQAPGGTAIVLRNTTAPSFTRMLINASSAADNYGIRGVGVNGFTMSESVLTGVIGTSALTANKDGGMRFEELIGTVNVTNTTVNGGYFTNIMVDNTANALDATFDNVDSLALDDTGGDDAVQFEGIGSADMDVEYKNSTIAAANGDMFQYIGDGTGGGDLDLTGNSFVNNDTSQVTGGGGLAIIGGAKGPVTLDILNNTLRNAKTNALTVIKSREAGGATNNLTANITGNTVGQAATANSGSVEGDGMEISTFGDGNATFNVTNNDIRQYNSSGIQFISGGGVAESGQMNLNVSGNTVQNPGTTPTVTLLQGIRVDSGVIDPDNFATCVKFGANTITGSSDAANKDFRLFAFQSGIRQPGYSGGSTDDTAFANYAASLIGGGAQGTAFHNTSPLEQYSGTGTTCP